MFDLTICLIKSLVFVPNHIADGPVFCPLDTQGHGQNVLYSGSEVAFISFFYGCLSRLQLEILKKCREINFDRLRDLDTGSS